MFMAECGITPSRVVGLDLLHALFLGPLQRWVWAVCWTLLSASIWGRFEPTESEAFKVSMIALRGESFSWYKAYHRLFPNRKLSRLANFTVAMVGTKNEFVLRAKAMDT